MSQIGEISVRITADSGNLEQGLKRSRKAVGDTSKELDKGAGFFKKYEGAIKAAASAAAAYAVSVGVKKIIANTVEQERATAQLDQALRSTGRYTPELSKEMQTLAASLQQVSTFGDETIIRAQGLLLTFTKVGGDTFPRATQAILDMSTAMQMDLKSATLQVGKALNDPILGVTALSRAGIQFSQQQRDVIKNLVDTNRVAEAQTLILKELETQFGGSALAARNTLGGAIDSLKNAFGDLLEGSGGNVSQTTEAINELTERLNDPMVKEGFQNIVSGALSVVTFLADATVALTQFGDKIGEVIFGPQTMEAVWQKQIIKLKSELIVLNNTLAQVDKNRPNLFVWLFEDADELKQRRGEITAELARIESDMEYWANRTKETGETAEAAGDQVGAMLEAVGSTEDVIVQASAAFADLQNKLVEQIYALTNGEAALESYQLMQKLGVDATKEEVEALQLLLDKRNELQQAEKAKEQGVKFADEIRERFKTEEQLLADKLANEQILLQQSVDAGIVSKAEQFALLEKMQAEHNKRLGEIQETTVPEGMKYSPEANREFLDLLEERYSSETELEKMRYKEQLERYEEAATQMNLSKAEKDAQLELMQQEHSDRMTAIKESEAQAQRNIAKNMFDNLSTLMNSGSKKMFQIGKTAAIASALVKGYEAVVSSYAAGAKVGGPIVGAAYAATAAAATAAQIGQIKKQQFGSGGSVTAYSGGVPATNTTTGGGVGPINPSQQQGRAISINLTGGALFTAEQIRELIGQINEQIGDGVSIATGG
jgi:hypothetical protein